MTRTDHWCLLGTPAGFPLTDTQLAGAYAVVSGHDAAAVDWLAFRHIPTLVVLMAGTQLPAIVEQLQATGWDPSTPVSFWALRPCRLC